MAWFSEFIKDHDVQNWIKAMYALKITKKGMHEFVKDELRCVHKILDIVNDDMRHSASLKVTNAQLKVLLDKLRMLLRDSKELANRDEAKKAIEELDNVQKDDFIPSSEETESILKEEFIVRRTHISKNSRLQNALLPELITPKLVAPELIAQSTHCPLRIHCFQKSLPSRTHSPQNSRLPERMAPELTVSRTHSPQNTLLPEVIAPRTQFPQN
ncbi:hypothetical protein MAR_004555 [Mya arenaria]|uniref:Uncharacterized protein n=1 Tax=Mya arenaria TaxID=6604 RepID=A0ABY7EWW6_MYAAR|nr:hypothetical protein MAR_004555 [Mya arenaria]